MQDYPSKQQELEKIQQQIRDTQKKSAESSREIEKQKAIAEDAKRVFEKIESLKPTQITDSQRGSVETAARQAFDAEANANRNIDESKANQFELLQKESDLLQESMQVRTELLKLKFGPFLAGEKPGKDNSDWQSQEHESNKDQKAKEELAEQNRLEERRKRVEAEAELAKSVKPAADFINRKQEVEHSESIEVKKSKEASDFSSAHAADAYGATAMGILAAATIQIIKDKIHNRD